MTRYARGFAALLLAASAACVAPGAESIPDPAAASGTAGTSTGAAGATATGRDPTAGKPGDQPRVICEMVRQTGSNRAVKECRYVRSIDDDTDKRGSEGWWKPQPSFQSN